MSEIAGLRSLDRSMRLAGENLLNCLDRDNGLIPFWELHVDRDYGAEMRRFWPAHNLGRWWDAMLRLEAATGFEIPGEIEAAMLTNLKRFFDNPYGLCLCPAELTWGEPHFELHSLREGLLALNSLIRYRNDGWARAQSRLMLESINRLANADGTWNMEAVQAFTSASIGQEYIDTTGSNGRLIEALVLVYEATGDSLAFDLAERFARHHFEYSTQADGTLNLASNAHHTHSYLGTLRGLLLFGVMTRRHDYVERVRKTYEITVRRMVKRSGYTSHDIGEERRGETSSSGDAAQLALWLSRLGLGDYLDDAEQIVRHRLLPSQLLTSPPLQPNGAGDDRFVDLDRRIVGGFGGMHRAPHGGKLNVTDVTAACLHTLVDIHSHVVESQPPGIAVNFHFDHDGPFARVAVERNLEGRIDVLPSTRTNIMLRIPSFVSNGKVRIEKSGEAVELKRVGGFAFIPDVNPAGVTMFYDLPETSFVERTAGIDYCFEARGDEIIGIAPHDDYYSFYPPIGA